MKPENVIRRNPCRGMRSRRWEKPRMNESSGKEGIPDGAIVGKLKSRPNKKRNNAEKTLFSAKT
jgi:hypothetical protein